MPIRNDTMHARIAALEKRIIPPLVYRVATLSAYERESYERWKHARQQWLSQFSEPYGAYAALIDGDEPPKLSENLRRKLFGCQFEIPVTATLDDAAEIYRRAREDEK